jgi:hypothetical protein
MADSLDSPRGMATHPARSRSRLHSKDDFHQLWWPTPSAMAAPLKVARGADREVGRRPGVLPHQRHDGLLRPRADKTFLAFGGPRGHRDALAASGSVTEENALLYERP